MSKLAFETLDTSSVESFISAPRLKCPTCKRSSQLYCPECALVLEPIPKSIELPVKLDIYRHPGEGPSKSTAVHAKLVAPNDTELFVENLRFDTSHFENRYRDSAGQTLLLFPSPTAQLLSDIDPHSYDRLVVIDGTWQQAKAMIHGIKHIKNLPIRHVKIAEHDTVFWRYQSMSSQYLATIEAIYFFYRDWFDVVHQESYDGRFDELLVYFYTSYERIQRSYKESGKGFTSRHANASSYIQKETE